MAFCSSICDCPHPMHNPLQHVPASTSSASASTPAWVTTPNSVTCITVMSGVSSTWWPYLQIQMHQVTSAFKEAGTGQQLLKFLCRFLSHPFHILTTCDSHPKVCGEGPPSSQQAFASAVLWRGLFWRCLQSWAGGPMRRPGRAGVPVRAVLLCGL